MQKSTAILCGSVQSVGPVITISRENKRPFEKRIIGIETEDQQLVFFESRNNLRESLPVGTKVEVEYYFAGSIKGDKSYNNIIASNIYLNE